MKGGHSLEYARFIGVLSNALIALSLISFIAVGVMVLTVPQVMEAFFNASISKIHSFGLIGSVLIMTIAALTAFPAELPAIACGAMYGLIPGSIITWISAMIGASVAFAVGRYVDPAFLEIVVGKKIFAVIRKRASEKTGIMVLLVVRLVPLFPFFVVNFASGMSGMRYTSYMVATGVGIIPGAVVCNAIGAGLMVTNTIIVLVAISILVLTVFSVKIFWAPNV
jgi:uncharacterized membrane protein YdjX (TVP38/TMEM64 family)